MKKAIYTTVFFSLFLIQGQPVQADLELSPSGLTVYDTDTGNSWYRNFDDFYFGSTYGAGPGSPTYRLNNDIVGGYDGKTNWGLATVDQIQGLLAEIPLTATGPADISNLFINAPWERGGGHYNPDWSIGPRWGGLTDTVAIDANGAIIPNSHTVLYLDFYKSIGVYNSYYTVFYGVGNDLGSGPYGSWLVSASSVQADEFEAVGANDTGTFTLSEGTHSVGTNLYIGMHTTGNGSYTLSNNGNLIVNGREEIGRYGTGVFNQDGGTNTIGGALYIARYPGSTGIYNLSGGTLNANGGIINNGTFNQTDGQNLPSSKGFSTGLSNSGTFNLASGALTLSPGNNVTTGGLSNSGTFNLTSGSLTLGNNANVTNTNTFNITGLGNSGGVLGSGGWGYLYNSIQNNPIQTPIQQLAYANPGTPVTGTITNSGNWNVTNTIVSYSASQVPNAVGAQVSLDYDIKSRFINSGSYRSDPSTSIFSNLINTSTGYLQGGEGDEFLIFDDFENMSVQSELWNTDLALLGFVGDARREHKYNLSGQAPSFEWGSLYLALDNLLVIQSTPSTGLYFERIILEDVDQLKQITSNIDIYYTSIVDLQGKMLDISGYNIQGEGRLIQGNPVPEPTTMLLFGTGLAGLAAARRRKRAC